MELINKEVLEELAKGATSEHLLEQWYFSILLKSQLDDLIFLRNKAYDNAIVGVKNVRYSIISIVMSTIMVLVFCQKFPISHFMFWTNIAVAAVMWILYPIVKRNLIKSINEYNYYQEACSQAYDILKNII